MDLDKRILVVDDEPLSVCGAIDCLNEAGYTTDYTSDSAKALQMLNEQPSVYKAVIVDRVMPEVNGLDLLHTIKSSPTLCNIPVIIETATEDCDAYLSALEAGASDFIFKPLEADFLLYVVNNAVNQKHADVYA